MSLDPLRGTRSLSERWISFCISVFGGAVALSVAVGLLGALMPLLVIVGGLAGFGWLGWRWWNGRNGW